VDEIRNIFASIDGALPERPFASFTGPARDGRGVAAAGTLALPDGRHYVAYLEKLPGDSAPDGAPPVSYVDEDLRLHVGATSSGIESLTESGYRVRYLEAFASPFEAGERYRFFWEALNPLPEEDDTEEERERDLRRGLARIEDLIRARAASALCDEVLRAEEEESAAPDPEASVFWQQAAATARQELVRLIPDPDRRESDLAIHRYRRAALRTDSGEDGR
jgi:hypothetical protein